MTLEPITDANRPDVFRLDHVRQWSPHLGGGVPRREASPAFVPAMLIRENASGVAMGTVENRELFGYPGVAVVLVFVDESAARPGLALQAFAMYVREVFESGARIVHLEVLEFNRRVQRMVERLGVEPQARLREHAFAAARFWDVIVYAFDRPAYERIWARYARSLPGSSRPAAVLGRGRRR